MERRSRVPKAALKWCRFSISARRFGLTFTCILVVGLLYGTGTGISESNYAWSSYRHDVGNTGFNEGPAPNTNETGWIADGASGAQGMSPAVADGKVFVCDDLTGNLTAFNETTGRQIWKYQGSSPFISSPVVAYGEVFMGSQGGQNVRVFNESTGLSVWNATIGGGGLANSAQVADGRVFYNAMSSQTLYCLNATTGQTLWTYPTGCNKAYPAVVDRCVFMAHYNFSSLLMGLYCLNESSGSVLWKYEVSSTKSMGRLTPAVAGGKVFCFIVATDSFIYCLNESSGSQIWKAQYPGLISKSPPALAYNTVYLSSQDGYVYAINAQNGTPSWRHYAGVASYQDSGPSTPAVADGKVFVSSSANVTCLNANTGDLLWVYKVSSPNPPVVADGCVMFSTPNALIAIGIPLSVAEFGNVVVVTAILMVCTLITVFLKRPNKRSPQRGLLQEFQQRKKTQFSTY
jgi:outer membrane protein assembly factor BamB